MIVRSASVIVVCRHDFTRHNINKNKKYLEQANLTTSQLIGQNIVKRTYFCKARESPLGVYLGMMVHAKTRKKGIVDKLYDLGISIPYSRVMELSTCLGNKVLQHYQHNNVVCPPSLKIGIFTTAAVDNIDHNPSSNTAEESLHGTGISLFQHPTKSNHGLEQFSLEAEVESDKLIELPEAYTNVKPISSFNRKPEYRIYSNVENQSNDLEASVLAEEERYIFKFTIL